jgi:penicillin-binding protein 2
VFDYVLLGQYPSEEDMVAVQKGLAAAPIGKPRQASEMAGVMSGSNPTPGPTTAAAAAAAKAKAAAIAEALSKLPPPMAAAGINPD